MESVLNDEMYDILLLCFQTLNMFVRDGDSYQRYYKSYNNILKLMNAFLNNNIYCNYFIKILINNFLFDSNKFRINLDNNLNIIYIFSRSFTYDPLMVKIIFLFKNREIFQIQLRLYEF